MILTWPLVTVTVVTVFGDCYCSYLVTVTVVINDFDLDINGFLAI